MATKKSATIEVKKQKKTVLQTEGEGTVTDGNVTWYQRHDTDTGSPEFQINLLSERITSLQEHLKGNHKDYDAKRTILRLVEQRRSHLKYLKLNNMERYLVVNKKTGLKV